MDLPIPDSPIKVPSAADLVPKPEIPKLELPKIEVPKLEAPKLQVPELPAAPKAPTQIPGGVTPENNPKSIAEPDFAKNALTKDAEGRNQMFEDVRKKSDELQATHAKDRAALEESLADSAPEAPAAPDALQAPKIEAPKLEAPKLETPKLETPKLEAPKLETPKLPEAPDLSKAIKPPELPKPPDPLAALKGA